MSSLTRYFGMCFGVLWGGFACVFVYRLSGGDRLRATDALLLFPVGVLGVGAAGVLSSAPSEGRGGLQQLKAGLLRWRVDWRWYALVLALPPLSVLAVLATLQALVSARFAPNRFLLGVLFGLLPGLAEEVGWTGFATRRMLECASPVTTGLQLASSGPSGTCRFRTSWAPLPLTAGPGWRSLSHSRWRSWPCES